MEVTCGCGRGEVQDSPQCGCPGHPDVLLQVFIIIWMNECQQTEQQVKFNKSRGSSDSEPSEPQHVSTVSITTVMLFDFSSAFFTIQSLILDVGRPDLTSGCDDVVVLRGLSWLHSSPASTLMTSVTSGASG